RVFLPGGQTTLHAVQPFLALDEEFPRQFIHWRTCLHSPAERGRRGISHWLYRMDGDELEKGATHQIGIHPSWKRRHKPHHPFITERPLYAPGKIENAGIQPPQQSISLKTC